MHTNPDLYLFCYFSFVYMSTVNEKGQRSNGESDSAPKYKNKKHNAAGIRSLNRLDNGSNNNNQKQSVS